MINRPFEEALVKAMSEKCKCGHPMHSYDCAWCDCDESDDKRNLAYLYDEVPLIVEERDALRAENERLRRRLLRSAAPSLLEESMEHPQCKGCSQPNIYGDKYDGYCLDCHNCEVPERDETIRDLRAKIERWRQAAAKDEQEIQQTLGKALKYPWCKDDQENFPGATEADGVYTGEHVAATLASEAAARIASLEAENERLRELLHDALAWLYAYSTFRLPYGEDGAEFERAVREFCQRATSELERKP